MRNILLIGFMGAGKSETAKALGRKTGTLPLDTDLMIEVREGKSIPSIFADRGEEYFRGLETKLLAELKKETGQIISCGGGMALRRENAALMKECGLVVWLDASPETIKKRVGEGEGRPLLKGRADVEGIRSLMEKRAPFYEAVSEARIRTDELTPEEAADRILALAAEGE